MQKITEMTREEIVALTQDNLKRMMDYECAENGIALLPMPQKPEEKKFEPDVKYYELGDMAFGTLEDAERVAEALKSVQIMKNSYDYAVGYDWKYLEPTSTKYEIVTRWAFSQARYETLRVAMAQQKQALDRYGKDVELYNKAQRKREDVCAYILEKYDETRDEIRNEDRLRGKFAEYLALADGAAHMAMTFLLKVETVTAVLREELDPAVLAQPLQQ